jgi:hypothetical protein
MTHRPCLKEGITAVTDVLPAMHLLSPTPTSTCAAVALNIIAFSPNPETFVGMGQNLGALYLFG